MPISTQGVHHITLVGADRQTSIDFWQGMLGMTFVFEQPNLDDPTENHLYFDPGDGRLITIFCNEERSADHNRTATDIGSVHHLAFAVSPDEFKSVTNKLKANRVGHSGVVDRGFMDSIYFKDPLGMLIEMACYKFQPPDGVSHARVLSKAHLLRLEKGDYNIDQRHLAEAIEYLE